MDDHRALNDKDEHPVENVFNSTLKVRRTMNQLHVDKSNKHTPARPCATIYTLVEMLTSPKGLIVNVNHVSHQNHLAIFSSNHSGLNPDQMHP